MKLSHKQEFVLSKRTLCPLPKGLKGPFSSIRQPGYLLEQRSLGFASPPHNGFAFSQRFLVETRSVTSINDRNE
jgi:hypothetical protein